MFVTDAFDGDETGVVSPAFVNQATDMPLVPPVIPAFSDVRSTVPALEPGVPSHTADVWFVTTGLGFAISGTALEVTGQAPPDVTMH